MKHIEFMGLPGSGKTTLCEETLSILKSMDRKAMSLEEAFVHCLIESLRYKPFRFIKYFPYIIRKNVIRHYSRTTEREAKSYNQFLLGNPELTQIILTALHDRQTTSTEREKIGDWIFRSFSRYNIVNQNLKQKEIVVLDEGFCNRSISLFVNQETQPNDELVYQYADAIPAPDIVFMIVSKPDICISRMSDRPGGYPGRMATLSVNEKEEFLHNASNCLDIVRNNIENRGSKVINIDNNYAMDKSIQEINNEFIP